MKRLLALLSAGFLLVPLLAVTAPAALAADYSSPASVTTTGGNTLNWNGQGTTNGSLDTVECDTNHTGYLLWIFTFDGATLGSPAPVLSLGGSGSGDYAGSQFGNEFHFSTPFFDPSTLSANVTFDATALGPNGSSEMNLTISHGCPGEAPPAGAPTIIKSAAQSFDFEYVWSITKAVDKSEIDLTPPASTATFNYTITVTHDSGSITNVSDVTGDITVFNGNDGAVTLDSVADQLSDGTTCSVDTSGGLTIPANGSTDFPYSCGLTGTFPADYPSTTNTATMAWSDQTLSDGTFLAAGSTDYTVDVGFNQTITDNCADVTDTYAGELGTVCVGDAGEIDNGDGTYSFQFTYPRTVPAPTLGTCQSYDNTASFADNSTPQNKGQADQRVTVCNFNAPLTIGYWANHLAKTGTSGCSGLPNGTGCSNNGPWTKQYLPQSLGAYSVSTFQLAAKVFAANNCSNASSSSQNAIGCLAAQLLGAELNVANFANFCIDPVIATASTFLTNPPSTSVTYGGYTGDSIKYTGPSGTYTLSSSQRNVALALKNYLVNYNQGGGCP